MDRKRFILGLKTRNEKRESSTGHLTKIIITMITDYQ